MRPRSKSRGNTPKKRQPRAQRHLTNTKKKRARRQGTAKAGDPMNRWTRKVTRESNALDLEPGVFTMGNPRAIAESLKRSADQSSRRKAEPYRSAMSMLTFYINRSGRQLSTTQRSRLERAKDELRSLYDKPRKKDRTATRRRSRTG